MKLPTRCDDSSHVDGASVLNVPRSHLVKVAETIEHPAELEEWMHASVHLDVNHYRDQHPDEAFSLNPWVCHLLLCI